MSESTDDPPKAGGMNDLGNIDEDDDSFLDDDLTTPGSHEGSAAGEHEKKRRHRRTFAELKRDFVCDQCQRPYATEHSLNQHIRLKHAPQRSPILNRRRALSAPMTNLGEPQYVPISPDPTNHLPLVGAIPGHAPHPMSRIPSPAPLLSPAAAAAGGGGPLKLSIPSPQSQSRGRRGTSPMRSPILSPQQARRMTIPYPTSPRLRPEDNPPQFHQLSPGPHSPQPGMGYNGNLLAEPAITMAMAGDANSFFFTEDAMGQMDGGGRFDLSGAYAQGGMDGLGGDMGMQGLGPVRKRDSLLSPMMAQFHNFSLSDNNLQATDSGGILDISTDSITLTVPDKTSMQRRLSLPVPRPQQAVNQVDQGGFIENGVQKSPRHSISGGIPTFSFDQRSGGVLSPVDSFRSVEQVLSPQQSYTNLEQAMLDQGGFNHFSGELKPNVFTYGGTPTGVSGGVTENPNTAQLHAFLDSLLINNTGNTGNGGIMSGSGGLQPPAMGSGPVTPAFLVESAGTPLNRRVSAPVVIAGGGNMYLPQQQGLGSSTLSTQNAMAQQPMMDFGLLDGRQAYNDDVTSLSAPALIKQELSMADLHSSTSSVAGLGMEPNMAYGQARDNYGGLMLGGQGMPSAQDINSLLGQIDDENGEINRALQNMASDLNLRF